jgi:uncharacterized membrane protein
MPAKPSKTFWVSVFVLAAIGIAAAILNLAILAKSPTSWTQSCDERRIRGTPGADAGAHPSRTAIHAAGATAIRSHDSPRVPRLHRWIGRLVLSLALVIGGSAFLMSFQMAIGGVNEMAATVLFDLLFLFCLAKGYAAARRLDSGAHREWMIRMFGIGLGESPRLVRSWGSFSRPAVSRI